MQWFAVVAIDAQLTDRGSKKWSAHKRQTWSFRPDHIAA